jgi:hypothetical protein
LDALEDLADLFADEELDEALPVLAGMAARTMVRPALRRAALSSPLRRQIVRSTTQVAQNLVRRQGPAALRALPRIAQSVGQTAARRRLSPSRLPQAIRQTGARVAAQPRLVRQLSRPAPGMRRTSVRPGHGRGGLPRPEDYTGPDGNYDHAPIAISALAIRRKKSCTKRLKPMLWMTCLRSSGRPRPKGRPLQSLRCRG